MFNFYKNIKNQLFGNSESKSVSTKAIEMPVIKVVETVEKPQLPRLFIDRTEDGYSLVPSLEGKQWIESVYVIIQGPRGLGGLMVATPCSTYAAMTWVASRIPADCKVVSAHSVPCNDWRTVGTLSMLELAIQHAH